MASLMALEQKAWELHFLRHHCQLSGSSNEVHAQYFEGWKEAYVFLPCQQWWRPHGLQQCQVLPQLAGLALPCLLPVSGLQCCCDHRSHSFSTFGSCNKLLTLDHSSAWTWQLAEVPRHLLLESFLLLLWACTPLDWIPLSCKYFDRCLFLTDPKTTPLPVTQDERSAASFSTAASLHQRPTTLQALPILPFQCLPLSLINVSTLIRLYFLSLNCSKSFLTSSPTD